MADYLAMLEKELAGVPYSKTEHRKRLAARLSGRSCQAIEYKHANISAVLLDLGFPYISGYKPRAHYQDLLAQVVLEQVTGNRALLAVAEASADQPMAVPEVQDILGIVTDAPRIAPAPA